MTQVTTKTEKTVTVTMSEKAAEMISTLVTACSSKRFATPLFGLTREEHVELALAFQRDGHFNHDAHLALRNLIGSEWRAG